LASELLFQQTQIDEVWAKAPRSTDENERNGYRQDKCGTWMKKSTYSDVNSKYGWEIDHILPLSKGGTDDRNNLQPFNWANNRDEADNLNWSYPNRPNA